MTLADNFALALTAKNNDLWTATLIIDRLTVGGILHLPINEMGDIFKQFAAGYARYIADKTTGAASVSTDTASADRLIRQALGDDNAE